MKWNIDFEIAAAVIDLIFIYFFFNKKHLPTRKNRYFVFSLIVVTFVTVLDMLSSYMDSNWKQYPLVLIHLINMLFFVSSAMLMLSVFLYLLALAGRQDIIRKPVFILFCIPFMMAVFLGVASPFTGLLYRIDPVLGYVHGPAFLMEFSLSSFYLLSSVIVVIVYRKRMTLLQFRSVVFFLIAVASGVVFQAIFFNWVLMANAVTSVAIVVVYLALQNPDMYIDKEMGLFNRDAFNEIVTEYAADGTRYDLIELSFSNFRIAQSVYGTERANEALRQAVTYVQTMFDRAYLFRIATDNFVLLDLYDSDFESTSRIITERFRQPWKIDNNEILFSVYSTYVPYRFVGKELKSTIRNLEYIRQKLPHTENELIIDEEIGRSMERDAAVERALEKAIDNKTVQIYFQPIFHSREAKAQTAEVLARLFDEEVGFVSPTEFVVKAEENGTVVELGRQIFEKVCMFLAGNDIEQYGIEKVSINLSVFQCMREMMAEEFMEMAQKYNVPMTRFLFEIIETATTEKDFFVRKNMDTLIAAGAEFILDDYGIGYSNIVNLFSLPFRFVKMDKSLVWTYFESDSDVLPDVIETFRNQKVAIIAQGVESRAMAKRLQMMGCDAMQGFYFSKPVPAKDFIRLMKEKNIEGGFGI
ncbi:MAG: EAL domain-containing protein [Lachnospiraceae bacterium]|nr:EAL domain-containing protein [Lachnospiraceae bacterium]